MISIVGAALATETVMPSSCATAPRRPSVVATANRPAAVAVSVSGRITSDSPLRRKANGRQVTPSSGEKSTAETEPGERFQVNVTGAAAIRGSEIATVPTVGAGPAAAERVPEGAVRGR